MGGGCRRAEEVLEPVSHVQAEGHEKHQPHAQGLLPHPEEDGKE